LNRRSRAFTLLEVMVAVAILGLSLTVILSAQAGLYAGGAYAQRTSVALGLLRCRMTEMEERLLKLGLPLAEEKDDGACCEGESRSDVSCEWSVERIELPQAKPPSLSSSSSPSSGGLGSLSALGGMGGPGASGDPSAGGGLAALGLGLSSGALAGDAGVAGIASALKQGTGGGVSMIAELAMAFVYPTLKPMLEASIRKLTVKVIWREGIKKRDITIIQYVTHPMRGDALTMGGADGGVPAAMPGLPGMPGMPGMPTGGGLIR